MKRKELETLGNGASVRFRGEIVTFVCLTLRFAPTTPTEGRKQQMRARIRWAGGGEQVVAISQLHTLDSGTP